MNITDRLLERIQGLTANDRTSGAWRIDEECDGLGVTVELEAFDRLGLMLRGIEMRSSRMPERGTGLESRLRRQADAVVERIKYLSEDFRVVEVDGVNGAVQLRSAHPHKEGPFLYFSQIVLRGGNSLTLERCRRHSEAKGMTEPADMNLSRETFARLIEDLAFVSQD